MLVHTQAWNTTSLPGFPVKPKTTSHLSEQTQSALPGQRIFTDVISAWEMQFMNLHLSFIPLIPRLLSHTGKQGPLWHWSLGSFLCPQNLPNSLQPFLPLARSGSPCGCWVSRCSSSRGLTTGLTAPGKRSHSHGLQSLAPSPQSLFWLQANQSHPRSGRGAGLHCPMRRRQG